MRPIIAGLWLVAGCREIYGLDDPVDASPIGGQGVLLVHALNGVSLFDPGQTDGNAWARSQTTGSLRDSEIGQWDGSGPSVKQLNGLGIDEHGEFSLWFEGSLAPYDTMMTFELVASSYAFVDLSFDQGQTWEREVESVDKAADTKTIAFPVKDQFYPVRIGWSNTTDSQTFLFYRKSTSEAAYASWTTSQLHYP